MHPFLISRRDLDAIEDTNREARDVIKGAKREPLLPKGDYDGAIYGGEVALGAFGAAVLYGRYNALSQSKIPYDLIAGIGVHYAAIKYADKLGPAASHLQAVLGTGLIVNFAVRAGQGIGEKMRDERAAADAAKAGAGGGGARVAGAHEPPMFPMPGPRPAPLTEAEQRARAQRFRRNG